MTDYIVRRATIESSRLSEEDNRYLTRVIPDMNDIKEREYLPEYPVFLRMEQDAYLKGDTVWCITTEDFQVGYIIGLCENTSGRPIISILKQINLLEKEFNIPRSSYSDLSFTIHQDVYIDFHSRKTLSSGRLNTGGTLFFFTKEGNAFIKAIKSSINQKANGTTEMTSINENHVVTKEINIKASSLSEELNKKTENILGSLNVAVGGDQSEVVGGNKQEGTTGNYTSVVLKKKSEIIGLGSDQTITSGGSTTTLLIGDYTVTTTLGSINLVSTSGLNIVAGASGVNVLSAGAINFTSPSVNINTLLLNLQALAIKTGTGLAGGLPGPFCSLPFCLFAGAPHTANAFTGF